MTTERKTRKTLFMVVIILLILLLTSFFSTKLVYDGIFLRNSENYDIADIGYNRTDLSFESNKNSLRGYLYDGNKKGLVIIAPGFSAQADDYLTQTEFFLEHGYGVFLFDVTGSGNSEGDSEIGFAQEANDLSKALDYINSKDNFGYERLFLFGHSRGGYAVCTQLKRNDISGVVAVSGLNSSMEAVMRGASDTVGDIAYGNYPMLWIYQSMLFGADSINTSACDMIDSASTPTLIVQGEKDEQSPIDEYSIYSHKDEISSPYVEYYICTKPGMDGHTDLLYEENGSANRELMNKIVNFYDSIIGG